MARKKVPVIAPTSEKELNEILGKYADAASKLKELEAQSELEITAVRDRYADRISNLKTASENLLARVQVWAETNPQRFDKKKSIDTVYGRFGFRTGTPKVKTLKGFTLASALELAKRLLPDFVRMKEELNKDLILMKAEDTGPAKLAEIGIFVAQDETFYIEIKDETINPQP